MKETIYNYDYLKDEDITEVVIRTKALIINNKNIIIGNENNIYQFPGGHFVSEDTMDNIYKDDIFQYEHIGDSKGVINLSGVNYPVYTINNNKMLSPIELSEFLMYNVSEILKYYEEFKEEKNYEYERNSKGNMAK